MTIRVDPEGNETNALFSLVDLTAKKVLEIGSGDGRLTWLYAHKAGHVTGIEPYAPSVALANQHLPHALKHRIEFHRAGIEEYAVNAQDASFDVILLSWALCWMTPEGMVHALDEIHRLLKPGGILIDIHPFAEPFLVEVVQDGRLLFSNPRVGGSTEGYRLADEAVEQAIQRNLYVLERNEQFDYLVYGSSVDELLDYHAQIDAYEGLTPEELLEVRQAEIYIQAQGILRAAGEGAEVVTHYKTHISRLKPVK